MDLKEKVKNNKLVTTIFSVFTVVALVAGFADDLASIFELGRRLGFSNENGWLHEAYLQIVAWLSFVVAFPAWSLIPVFALAACTMCLLLRQRSRLAMLSKELDALKNPVAVELSSLEERVLFWIKKIYDKTSTGEGPTPVDVATAAEMTLSNVEGIVDTLKGAELVRLKKFKSDPLDLTSKGREYFKSLAVLERYDAFEINLLRKRI